MNGSLQGLLLRIYRVVLATGLLSTGLGRAVFEAAYFAYKEHFEAKFVRHLRPYARSGTTVIDVGANIGFFTWKFGQWVGKGGRVIAIEPDTGNFQRLEATIARRNLGGVVEALQGVAADTSGERHLRRNPVHPGDHRLAAEGTPVRAWTIDGLLAERGWPEVSLIKIDVQGAEDMVIQGAAKTLARFHPALFVEIDNAALEETGSTATALLERIAAICYKTHIATNSGPGQAMMVDEIVNHLDEKNQYLDVICLSDP